MINIKLYKYAMLALELEKLAFYKCNHFYSNKVYPISKNRDEFTKD